VIDKLKLLVAVLCVAGGIVAFHYLGEKPVIVQLLALLCGLVAAVVVAATSAPGQRAWVFMKDARQELRKVVWPNNRETAQVTLVVVVLVVVAALFLMTVDWGLGKLFRLVTGQGA
jgi:preprotein translocase subunit SecE